VTFLDRSERYFEGGPDEPDNRTNVGDPRPLSENGVRDNPSGHEPDDSVSCLRVRHPRPSGPICDWQAWP
jgi:hypothetical protein